MFTSPARKNKIILSDYNYKKDIENRLLLAELTPLEVDVLHEVLHNSLTFPLNALVDALGISLEETTAVLQKLSGSRLLSLSGKMVKVDKEMRKYYEFQMMKFEEDFKPDLEFIQGLLNQIPIHILPVWYAIPRSSDHIFQSILEKYLQTPKIYQKYLQELKFDEPLPQKIMQEVFEAPDYKLCASTLIAKYGISRAAFEEALLLLEYHFVCYLSYQKVEGDWQEVITPFHEWREYLCFQRDNLPQPITDTDTIERSHARDFGFILDCVHLLEAAKGRGISLKKTADGQYGIKEEHLSSYRNSTYFKAMISEGYLNSLIHKLLHLHFAKLEQEKLRTTPKGEEWLKKPLQDQAHTLYNYSLSHPQQVVPHHPEFTDRDIRHVEKSLRPLSKKGWIYLEDFLKWCIAPIGKTEPVTLKNKGKRWRYVLPQYTDTEKKFIEAVIRQHLFTSGMIAKGIHQGKLCFCVTPFGRISLDDF